MSHKQAQPSTNSSSSSSAHSATQNNDRDADSASNVQTQITWMNREMAERLAQKEEEERLKNISATGESNTKRDSNTESIQTTVFEYDDDDCGEYNPEDEDTKRRIIPMHELRPMLEKLKSTAQHIRHEYGNDAEWDSARIHTEMLQREPDIAARIARTDNYEFVLKYIASKIYTANHDNILGYLLYMWEMVEQGNISLSEAKAMVEPNIRKMTQDIEMREKQEQRQREKRERKMMKKKNKDMAPPNTPLQ